MDGRNGYIGVTARGSLAKPFSVADDFETSKHKTLEQLVASKAGHPSDYSTV